MRSYAQYCPVAKATEILGDRWTLLIVREMLGGASGFNELQRGLPGISRSVLTDRMRALERAEVIERRTGPKGRTLEYRLTPAGRDLQPVVQAIGEWGATWSFTEPRPEELDPDLLIVWMARHVDRQRLPPNRTVVQFDFRDPKRRYWMVLEPSEVSVCLQHPGFDVDLEVTVDTTTLYRVYLGRAELGGAIRAGQLTMSGPRTLQRGFGHWFTWSAFAPASRRRGGAPHSGLTPRQPSSRTNRRVTAIQSPHPEAEHVLADRPRARLRCRMRRAPLFRGALPCHGSVLRADLGHAAIVPRTARRYGPPMSKSSLAVRVGRRCGQVIVAAGHHACLLRVRRGRRHRSHSELDA